MQNQKDMTRCHCGGQYKLLKRTPTEVDRRLNPAVCSACSTFYYLQGKELNNVRH